MKQLFVLLLLKSSISLAAPTHGMALMGEPKYKEGFSHFEYANPDAPKGGTLKLGSPSAFDSLNAYTLKGISPAIISTNYGTVVERLMAASSDEAFSAYGLLAEKMELAKDKLSTTFYLRKEAKFSDGKPVTAADVKFTFEMLISDKGSPGYRSYYADVKSVKVISKRVVKFIHKKVNNELHMILAQLAVLPKHVYGKGDFAKDFTKKIVGSGPYVLDSFESGKFLKLKRNPNYWGANINVNKGRHNYDEIIVKIFRDPTIWLEGFKAGEFDFAQINSSKQWAVDVAGKKWDMNWIVKGKLPDNATRGMQGFIMNTRRPLFKNKAARKALALIFDFEWMNKTLFYNQYTAHKSYFDNSELGAIHGLPNEAELKLLNPLKGKIPEEVFTTELEVLGKGLNQRQRLRMAKQVLDKDGWKLKNGVLTKGNLKFEFELLIGSAMWDRIVEPYISNVKKLGIQAKMIQVDTSLFVKRVKGFNFDMIVTTFGQSLSPGNEQRTYWHSSSADQEGSSNYIGLKDPAIDTLVDAIISANDRPSLIAATRALDRVLWFGYYVVPHWYINYHRVTYWNRFSIPKKLPTNFAASDYFVSWSWADKAKAKKLDAAMKNNAAVIK